MTDNVSLINIRSDAEFWRVYTQSKEKARKEVKKNRKEELTFRQELDTIRGSLSCKKCRENPTWEYFSVVDTFDTIQLSFFCPNSCQLDSCKIKLRSMMSNYHVFDYIKDFIKDLIKKEMYEYDMEKYYQIQEKFKEFNAEKRTD